MDKRYVVIIDKSAGNDMVGEMWKETKIFPGTATLDEVMDWASVDNEFRSRNNITLTRPHEQKENEIG